MGIDWVTVVAQIVNFLILVWLLKRFLYEPVTAAIAAREAQFATGMAETAQAKIEAEKIKVAYQDKADDLERQKNAYLATAREDAGHTRLALERKARQEVDASDAAWRKRLEIEHARYLTELRDRAALSIVKLTRKVLSDLADDTLEAQIERQFEHRIRTLAPDLAEAVGKDNSDAPLGTISTRFPLSETLRASITRVVSEAIGREVTLTFEETASEPPGIVLKISGLRVGWTIDTYLDALEADIAAYLKNPPVKKYAER